MKRTVKTRIAILALVLSVLMTIFASAASVSDFTDVKAGSWYYEPVAYATSHEMVAGTSATTFSPNAGMTRAQFVTILRKALGATDEDYRSQTSRRFADVPSGAYYEQPVYWATVNGIVSGTGENSFSPSQALKRQDMAVMVEKAVSVAGLKIDDKNASRTFSDDDQISAYARSAVNSLQRKGLLAGDNQGRVQPKKTMTRAEGTTVLVAMVRSQESSTDLPIYSGQPYVELNGNVPSFTASELAATESYETYSPLDSLGRCGPAMACIGQDLMPTEERGNIGSVTPTGWHLVRYDDLISDKYLYNRCHLIAYELSGENANERNLITGTRYMNVQGMLPFENKVANYVKSTGNHVLYRSTPVFEGDNLLASGVQIEARSLEDGGKGICFNIYCFNVQPGVGIDYSTGDSWRTGESVITEPETTPAADQTRNNTGSQDQVITTDSTGAQYVVNTNSKKFHYPSCSSASQIKEKNKAYASDRQALIDAGYDPCKNCNP